MKTCRSTIDISEADWDRLADGRKGIPWLIGRARCAMAIDHPGQHVDFIDDDGVYPEDALAKAWFLSWNHAGTELVHAQSCRDDCRLPANHAPAPGCPPEDPGTCTEVISVSSEDVARLEALPEAANEVRAEMRCELFPGHPGAHHAEAQSNDIDLDHPEVWWVRWSGESYELAPLPLCPTTRPYQGDPAGDICTSFEGHPGEHDFQED